MSFPLWFEGRGEGRVDVKGVGELGGVGGVYFWREKLKELEWGFVFITISGSRDEKIMRSVPTQEPQYKLKCIFAPVTGLNLLKTFNLYGGCRIYNEH